MTYSLRVEKYMLVTIRGPESSIKVKVYKHILTWFQLNTQIHHILSTDWMPLLSLRFSTSLLAEAHYLQSRSLTPIHKLSLDSITSRPALKPSTDHEGVIKAWHWTSCCTSICTPMNSVAHQRAAAPESSRNFQARKYEKCTDLDAW